MRTPMNYLLVNLAVADITVAVFIAIRYIFTLFFTHPKGKAGDFVCQLLTGEAFMWVGALASAFSLVCIALERYLAINNNNNNNNNNEFLNRMALQYMRTVIKGVL